MESDSHSIDRTETAAEQTEAIVIALIRELAERRGSIEICVTISEWADRKNAKKEN
jgi:hypothetical protein